jgi:hypothetical protein
MGLWVRIPPGAWMHVVSAMCCQVEVSSSGWSFVQRNSAECDLSSECDREASITRRPWPTSGCCSLKNYKDYPSQGLHAKHRTPIRCRRQFSVIWKLLLITGVCFLILIRAFFSQRYLANYARVARKTHVRFWYMIWTKIALCPHSEIKLQKT